MEVNKVESLLREDKEQQTVSKQRKQLLREMGGMSVRELVGGCRLKVVEFEVSMV